MTHAAQRLSTNRPGKLQSHPAHNVRACPYGTGQEPGPEGLHEIMCELTHDDGPRPLLRLDDESFRLHLQFMHAHGVPKGEFTIFSNTGTLAGDGPRGMHAGSER